MVIRKIQGNDMYFYKDNDLILTVEEPTIDGKEYMILKGELVNETVSHIQDELDAFSSAHIPITVDFKGVTYCSSIFIDALVNSQAFIDSIRCGELTLKNIPKDVYDLMDLHNVTDIFYIEDEN